MKVNKLLLPLLFAGVTAIAQTPIKIKETATTKHGPEKGSLIIIGGGANTPEIWAKFLELAGGKDKADIVVITAATGDSAAYNKRSVERIKKEFGISKVTMLHTNNLTEANSEQFIAPLKTATGVYFDGGRQWRIADSYLNTLTHQAFFDVLNRGGVIVGSSAGASIQGSFLWRGDTKGPHILIGDHTQGLGFLKNSAIDQHLLKRNREFDLVDFIRKSPELIGIGLDESTAIVVQRDTLEVLGKSYAVIYDHKTIVASSQVADFSSDSNTSEDAPSVPAGPFFFLGSGQRYDLRNRKVIQNNTRRQANSPAVNQTIK
ncbi:cyanophycinase [Segetibacter sp. 3557_3]|uniref:cyanophycinase n=1 Tax=Segetibacter sp. 3557_3 TaxID=2547429 RepID=UPI0010588B2C|nr:cyanophycinase [Segetibacter sp. 3557_3]TDH24539.1 cyanophycinase [Segetibacter sp. 3557_3]